MSTAIRRYVRETSQEEFDKGFTEQQVAASQLRIAFLQKYIISADTNAYKSVIERDWAYIAKREYNYDVLLDCASKGAFVANLVWSARIYQTKRMCFWPLALVPAFALYFYPQNMMKHNKKLFDMCNVGEQYFLGNVRNQVLKQCNEIQGVQDF